MAESSTISSLKLLSWNIDGLDERNTIERTQAVCDIIKSQQPDCVCLQEVIPPTWDLILQELQVSYECYISSKPHRYFPAILVRKAAFSKIGPMECIDFERSMMGRHLLRLPVCFGANVEIDFLTSHLESTKMCSNERKRQLRVAFDIMVGLQEADKLSIFAGDMNVRDYEVDPLVPERVADVWLACGAQRRHEFTWDVSDNDNLDWPHPHKPKLRFDRIYLSPSDGIMKPKKFELIGKEWVRSCWRFPSDHWGMWAEFEIIQDVDEQD